MHVDVGTSIIMREQNYICTEINQYNQRSIAKESSTELKSYFFAGANNKILQHEIEDYDAGDFIHTTGERIIFVCPGKDIQFVWTFYKIVKINKEKENENAQQRLESTIGEGTDSKVESTGERDSSGRGAGKESVGEVGGAVHTDGCSGESGVAGTATVSEGS